jgi:competence protein ComEC
VIESTGIWPVDENLGWIGQVHRRTDAALGYGLRPQEAAVVRGMLLGDHSLIPEDLEVTLRRSGVAHVLAISGQHIAILAAMNYFALRALAIPTLLRNPATLALIWLYILLAGTPSPAIRVVATFALAAWLFGRQLSPFNYTN